MKRDSISGAILVEADKFWIVLYPSGDIKIAHKALVIRSNLSDLTPDEEAKFWLTYTGRDIDLIIDDLEIVDQVYNEVDTGLLDIRDRFRKKYTWRRKE